MIKDLKQIKEHLKGHSEIELPYPFKKDVHIKYITIKDGDESFYVGGKFIKILDNRILLCNNGKSWTVPISMKNKEGDVIYKSRFFVHKDFEKREDKKVSELESIIKSQQEVIKKLSQQVKMKAEDNEKLKLYIQQKLQR